MRRRVSSDGLQLFNIAFPPSKSKIKQLLTCIFRTEYDDKLDDMVDSCRLASQQIFGYYTDPLKRRKIDQYSHNAVLNLVHAIICNDGKYATAFEMKRNYYYFLDVMEFAFRNDDHNTVLLIYEALEHPALKQMQFKLRRKHMNLIDRMKDEYGTKQDRYVKHLRDALCNTDYGMLPSMTVMRKHMQYNTKKEKIHSKIGLYGIHNVMENYGALPLYDKPLVDSSSDLIMIASRAR